MWKLSSTAMLPYPLLDGEQQKKSATHFSQKVISDFPRWAPPSRSDSESFNQCENLLNTTSNQSPTPLCSLQHKRKMTNTESFNTHTFILETWPLPTRRKMLLLLNKNKSWFADKGLSGTCLS